MKIHLVLSISPSCILVVAFYENLHLLLETLDYISLAEGALWSLQK